MNRMQEWLMHAAKELGIRIIVGHVVQLPNGSLFPTQALFPDLGGELGMIVLASANSYDSEIRHALVEKGFSISTFSSPLPNEEFDLDNYQEMFSEWGWTGDDNLKPKWMS